MLQKSLAARADVLSFDLEDSVAENDKPVARDTLHGWLKSEELANFLKNEARGVSAT